ncbi:MAG: TSUP family transporter [Clostridiales bacterium]|nr:TSUP family transporter [Clostridiales bacterium]
MRLTPDMFLIVCPLALLAGFIDSVAGGGGMISLPAYYLAGLPPALASGTNKLSAMMGTTLATVSYGRAGKLDRQVGVPAALGAFLCSAMGALLMTSLPANVVRLLVLVCIPVAALLTLRGRKRKAEAPPRGDRAVWWISLAIGCGVGFYDGLIGPGTGTFLILLFLQVFAMEEVLASGTAKLVNLASNAAALISLIATGDVAFLLGIPAGLCAMLGAWLGSRLTIRRGGGFVRAMMLVVLALLLAKMLADMVG